MAPSYVHANVTTNITLATAAEGGHYDNTTLFWIPDNGTTSGPQQSFYFNTTNPALNQTLDGAL